MSKALLFINGEKPTCFPNNTEQYNIISCTDGAYTQYVKELPININYISGDLDSIDISEVPSEIKIIPTPNQDKTDFHKALEILLEKNIVEADVYGASGKESDHFIGNLATALFFKNKLKITFFDDYATFFFIDNYIKVSQVKNKTISLIPFFEVKNITTKGLKFSLNNETLSFPERIGTRNTAEDDTIEISYSSGNLLLYIGK